MRHVDLLRSTAAVPVMQPWDYVTMRRRAAGLSIEQVAQALGGRAYERHLRLLETPGMRVRILADLNTVLPFSDDVYRQLADLPPHQHPRLCQRCGWDEHSDVPDRADGLTTWSRADATICTRCEQRQEAA
ncbi:hypothetical protein [Sphingobium yanoikuyae]|uniref:hypothetical protein n=1 Tax=Sphingobium yanoikuyae TaxID=13690 RepID=UPI002431D560|nr:hypothetical protein [Sphingobium yanoikuyae]